MNGVDHTSARKSCDQQALPTQDQRVDNLNTVGNTVPVTIAPELNHKMAADSVVCK